VVVLQYDDFFKYFCPVAQAPLSLIREGCWAWGCRQWGAPESNRFVSSIAEGGANVTEQPDAKNPCRTAELQSAGASEGTILVPV
jgi:hypothetical protein